MIASHGSPHNRHLWRKFSLQTPGDSGRLYKSAPVPLHPAEAAQRFSFRSFWISSSRRRLKFVKQVRAPCHKKQRGQKSRLLKAQPGEQGNAEGRHRCQGHRHHSAHPQQKSGGRRRTGNTAPNALPLYAPACGPARRYPAAAPQITVRRPPSAPGTALRSPAVW